MLWFPLCLLQYCSLSPFSDIFMIFFLSMYHLYLSPFPWRQILYAYHLLSLSQIYSSFSVLSYLTSSWVAAILVPSFFTTPNDSLLSSSKWFYLNSPAIRCSCRWQYHRRERERKGSRTVRQVWKGRGTRRRTGRGTGQLLVLETIS